MPQTATQQITPGSRFSVPPFTDEVEQPENNDGLIATFAAGTQTQVQGIIPFQQSDVIYCWLLFMAVTETITGSTSITPSAYWPEIYLGPFQLNMQYQYPAIDVATGKDLAIINELRPFRPGQWRNQRSARLVPSLYSTQADQVTSNLAAGYPAPTTAVQRTVNWILEVPTCCYFHEYYELDETGNPISGPHNGYVSPANMGGYARVVTPSIKLNALINAGNDQAAYVAVGTPAGVGTVNIGISRLGVLGNVDASVLPQPTNWQYNIAHLRWACNGVGKTSIPLNAIFAGQIMSVVVRLYDPVLNAGSGGPVVLATQLATTTNSITLRYGGSVMRWQGNQSRMQKRFGDQHGYLPTEGVVVIDLATDVNGQISNSYLLNTLRTASVALDLIFASATSATTYAEVTIEGMRYVPLPVRPGQ